MHRRKTIADDSTQFAAKDLAGRAGRKLPHHLEALGQLEFRDFPAKQKAVHLIQIEGCIFNWNDERASLFAELGIGHRHHAGVLHLRMAQNVVFNFLATDFFASAIDDVLEPTLDVEIAVNPAHHVAHAIEAFTGERGPVFSGAL